MNRELRKLLLKCWLPVARRAATAYVAGPGLIDALQACRWWSQRGLLSTVCYWNEASDQARRVADAYLTSLDVLAREKLDCYLSVKAPPLDFSHELFSEVLNRAKERNIRLHFDSLSPEAADVTFSLISEARRDYANLGCTLPGRWRRSLSDAERAVEMGLNVRVVKGQWLDPREPEVDVQAGFLALIDRLAGRTCHVAVATHDPMLARDALERLRDTRTPCELELLYGFPVQRMVRVARSVGVPARLYIPYGYAWLPYTLSRANQDIRVVWWLIRDLMLGGSARQGRLFYSAGRHLADWFLECRQKSASFLDATNVLTADISSPSKEVMPPEPGWSAPSC